MTVTFDPFATLVWAAGTWEMISPSWTALDIKVSSGPKAATYKCNASILAPSVEEAPDYVAGTEVAITLRSAHSRIPRFP